MKFESPEAAYLQNGSSSQIVDWLRQNVTKEHTFIDVGAHIGIVFIPIVLMCQPKRAIAFEPTPESFFFLKKNCEANNVVCEIHNKAVMDKTGVSEMYVASWGSASNTFEDRFEGKNNKKFKIDTVCIDDLGIKEKVILKIDAELSEPKIWKGMKKTFPYIDAIVMEIFAEAFQRDMKYDVGNLLDEIRADRFQIYNLNHEIVRNDWIIKQGRTDIIIKPL